MEDTVTNTRTRGIICQPVDAPSDLGYPFTDNAIAYDPAGNAYIICGEGVGHPITPEDVQRTTAKGDPMDLADFIRTFGARLDNNHYLWVRKLGGTYVITGTLKSGRRMHPIVTQTPEHYNIWRGTLWYRTPDGKRTKIRDYRN